MNNAVLGIIFIVLAILGIMLKSAYFHLPLPELKRRAEKKEKASQSLYKVSTYGFTLQVLLWLYIGFTAAAGFILLARSLSFWLSLLIIGPLIYIVFSLIPNLPSTKANVLIARGLSPVLSRLLYYIHPLFSRGQNNLSKTIKPKHSGIYEKEDLLNFLTSLKKQPNRIDKTEIDQAIRTIEFSSKKVMDIMLPAKAVKTVKSSNVVGPVLINDIHESGQSYILVKEGEEIVGVLAFADLGIKSSGLVEDIMETKITFVDEDEYLSKALQSLFESKYPVLIVTNNFGDFEGILTIESVIKEILGDIKSEE